MARPVAATRSQPVGAPLPQWIWGAYYGICVWWIIGGAGTIVDAIQMTHKKFLGEEMGWSFFTYVSIAIGVLTILFAIGMMARLEVIRGIVNFACGLQIIFGLMGLTGALLGSLFSGPWGLLLVLSQVIQIATSAFMIYLIGETDKYAM